MHTASLSRALRRLAAAGRRARGAVALVALLLPAFAPPPTTPLEQRLGEAWRWRFIDGLDGSTSVFRLVRPGRDGGLLALDDEGLLAYDGWVWHREKGWSSLTDEEVRDIAPLEDGLLVVATRTVLTVDASGVWRPIGPAPSPAMVSQACHHPDGHVDIARNGHVERASIKQLEPLLGAPPGVHTIMALTHDPSGSFWCATDVGVFRQQGDGWLAVPGPPPQSDQPSWFVQARGRRRPAAVPCPRGWTRCTPRWRGTAARSLPRGLTPR